MHNRKLDYSGLNKEVSFVVVFYITGNLEIDSCSPRFSNSRMLGLTSSPLQDSCHSSSNHIWVSARYLCHLYQESKCSSRTSPLHQYTSTYVHWPAGHLQQQGKVGNPCSVSKESGDMWYRIHNVNSVCSLNIHWASVWKRSYYHIWHIY